MIIDTYAPFEIKLDPNWQTIELDLMESLFPITNSCDATVVTNGTYPCGVC